VTFPTGILPLRDLTTREILYGSRETSFRFELLSHDSSTGVDSLAGYLDGVDPSTGGLNWESGASVKKSGTMSVTDVPVAREGLTRVADVDLLTVRVRPVRVIEGLPETPLSVYLLNASPEAWSGTGRTYELVLHDKSTVLAQDAVAESFTAGTSDPILEIVADVIASAGERITVDGSDTRKLSFPSTWEAGTSKLTIVNDLLRDSLGYNALWVDGLGNFRATPYVAPGDRSVRYSVLNDEEGNRLQRELVDGPESIYSPEWTRDRVNYKVPNRVIAVASGAGDGPALVGMATNDSASSPYSTVSRGRVITLDSGPLMVDVPDFSAEGDPEAATVAFLEAAAQRSLSARSAVQSAVSVKALPIPLELMDAIRFAHTPAGVDALHTVRSAVIPFAYDGWMDLELQEVIV